MSEPRGGCHELEDGTDADRVPLSRERGPALSTGQLNDGDLRSDTTRRRVRPDVVQRLAVRAKRTRASSAWQLACCGSNRPRSDHSERARLAKSGSASLHPRGGNRPSLWGGGHERHPFRAMSLRNCQTCDITLWNVPEPGLGKAQPCRWHRQRSCAQKAILAVRQPTCPRTPPFSFRQDEHEV